MNNCTTDVRRSSHFVAVRQENKCFLFVRGVYFSFFRKIKVLTEITNIMDSLYNEQRMFLNNFENPPTVQQITEKWPFLLRKYFLMKHFSKLTEISIPEVLSRFDAKLNDIVFYAENNKKKVFEKINSRDKDEKFFLNFVCAYFKEDVNFIFKSHLVR